MPAQTLVCIECKATKPITEFWKDNAKSSRSRGNRNSRCRDCAVARRTRYPILDDDDPQIIGENRRCNCCGETKALSQFQKSQYGPFGRGYRCKECGTHKKIAAPRFAITAGHLLMKFKRGVSTATFTVIYEAQNGQCPICKTKLNFHSRETVLDHDHTTKLIRGILCMKCNLGLGHFGDDIQRLEAALEYLRHHAAFVEIKNGLESNGVDGVVG